MADKIGSSRIPEISSVLGGSYLGPTGSTGPTGPTGGYATGPSGLRGKGVLFAEGISQNAFKVYLNDNPQTTFDIQFQGPTGSSNIGLFSIGFTGDEQAINFVQLLSGATLLFKGISLQGELAASYSSNNLVIRQNTESDAGDFIPGTLLYVGLSFGDETYFNILPALTSVYEENNISGLTYSTLKNTFYAFLENFSTDTFNYSRQTNSPTAPNLDIDINAAFYGVTFTPLFDSLENSTPYLRYRVNYSDVIPNTNVNTETISFRKRITEGQSGFEQRFPEGEDGFIGSCCYCTLNSSDIVCKDYISKKYCEEQLFGRWNFIPCYKRTATNDCYPGGACCVNNKCLTASRDKCVKMGGSFIPGENCSSITCPDRCELQGTCCCVRGESYPLNEELCSEIENSRFFNQPCSEIDCCLVGNLGACCIRSVCYDNYTAAECSQEKGIFQGTGSQCVSQYINCCTDPTLASGLFQVGGTGGLGGINCIRSISCGANHSCIVKNNGQTVCWGLNSSGQTNVPISGSTGIQTPIQVSCGGLHTCIIQQNGDVKCWGSNAQGQTTVPGLGVSAKDISCGLVHTSIVRNDGSVATWGGELLFPKPYTNRPVGNIGAVAIKANPKANMALLNTGGITCWPFSCPTDFSDVKVIGSDNSRIYAVQGNGNIGCLKTSISDPFGAEFLTTCDDFISPGVNVMDIQNRENISSIEGGWSHVMVRYSDNTAIGYGSDQHYQTFIPSGLGPFSNVDAGYFHSLLVRTDGVLTVLGNNAYGQKNVPSGANCITGPTGGTG